MKTTIGVTQSGRFSPTIEVIAEEFFGVIAKGNPKGNILWLTFPSKKNAQEFSQAIALRCIDKDRKVFK